MSTNQQVFEFGRIHSNQDWLFIGAAAAAVFAVVWAMYRRELCGQPRSVALLLPLLRVVAVGVLGWIALDPRTRTETAVVDKPRVALLLDRSASMNETDRPSGRPAPTRLQQVVQTLTGELANERWKGRERITYAFAKEVAAIDGGAAHNDESAIVSLLQELHADGQETRLGDAVAEVVRREADHRLAALIVFSDGRLNAGAGVETAIAAAKRAKVPVYSIGVGAEEAPPNVRMVDLRLPARVFRGEEVRGEVLVQSTGFAGRALTIDSSLSRRDGQGFSHALTSSQVVAREGPGSAVSLAFTPNEAGHWTVVAKTPVLPGEARADDNQISASLEVVDRKTKVLLLASAPGREYQFLSSLLTRDNTVDLTVQLQSTVAGTNLESRKLLTNFPTERMDLSAFDVLVAIDPDWRKLADFSRKAVFDWTSTQAGGLCLVAGPLHTSSVARDFPDFAALYPVVPRNDSLDSPANPGVEGQSLEFTHEGETSRALLLDDDAEVSRRIWRELRFFAAHPVDRVRPGAAVWIRWSAPEAKTHGGDLPPLLATQFYGSGRVLYLGSGELWRLRRLGEKYYERLWRQLIRHLGEGRLQRGSGRGGFLFEQHVYPPGASVPVAAYLLGEQYQPLRTPSVRASVETRFGRSELNLEMQKQQPGRYAAIYAAPASGAVRFQLSAPGGSIVEDQIEIEASRRELEDVRLDRALLTRLAAETGGAFLPLNQLNRLDSLMPDRVEKHISCSAATPVWDGTWTMLAFIGLLSIEWIVRKLRRLS